MQVLHGQDGTGLEEVPSSHVEELDAPAKTSHPNSGGDSCSSSPSFTSSPDPKSCGT